MLSGMLLKLQWIPCTLGQRNSKPGKIKDSQPNSTKMSMKHNQEQRLGHALTRKSHAKFQCPAKTADCYNCGKRGHYGKVCKSTKSVSAVTEDDNIFLGTVDAGEQAWTVDLQVRHTNVRLLSYQSRFTDRYAEAPHTTSPQVKKHYLGQAVYLSL